MFHVGTWKLNVKQMEDGQDLMEHVTVSILSHLLLKKEIFPAKIKDSFHLEPKERMLFNLIYFFRNLMWVSKTRIWGDLTLEYIHVWSQSSIYLPFRSNGIQFSFNLQSWWYLDWRASKMFSFALNCIEFQRKKGLL